jgi:hypothetical protein
MFFNDSERSCKMAKFMVVHRFVGDPDEDYKAMNEPELVNALVEANGRTVPGRCIYTWIPFNYGRKDLYGFCLWEADSAEDVKISIEGVTKYLTADIMQVDQLVWEELAAAILAKA